MNSYEVTVNGRTVKVEAVSRTATTLSFVVQGKRYDVEVSAIQQAMRNGPDRTTLPSRPPAPARNSKTDNNPDMVIAPMPGIISAILVSPGQAVQARQPLLVIEAMKMENNITAPREGMVKEIHVTVGQEVENARLLVSLQ